MPPICNERFLFVVIEIGVAVAVNEVELGVVFGLARGGMNVESAERAVC